MKQRNAMGRPRKPHHILTETVLRATLHEYRAGATLRDLAAKYGRSPSVIHKRLERARDLVSMDGL